MIAQINGKVIRQLKNCIYVDVNGICYEILIPETIMSRIKEQIDSENRISLYTFHYLHVEPSRSVPIIVGFINEIEKEFFGQFITVSGVGPRAALRALNRSISDIAQAIDEGNLNLLRTLPGIGLQKAKEIVAKLQGKVGKFCLIQDRGVTKDKLQVKEDVTNEALRILLKLQYKQKEAQEMIKKALERSSGITTTEELLNEVYRQKTP